ncbi:MAG TPA: efflux transporter outer membrane subunit [Gemmatimonadaceae bacterium]|nr:efflux transporter outer membrane subunit [Gemmatimonadaceae bacterium]
MTSARLSVVAALLMVSGCNLAPHYEVPATPAPEGYKETAGVWQVAEPQDSVIKGKWWEMFNEPELDSLENRLNINNQNIAQAFQSFMAARAEVREARAGYFPTVSTSPTYTRSGGEGSVATGTHSTAPTNLYSLPLDASWAPDLFDRVRNTVRAAQYAAQVSAADLENERLAEQASLAELYFQLRGQDALQDLFNRTIDADRQNLDLTKNLYQNGIDSQEAVDQADVTLRNTEATAVGIATNRAIYEHAIATLIGTPASSFAMPVRMLNTQPPPIPVGVPSQLLQRRPDIAASERTIAQANALIGVQKAAFFPSVSLTGSVGVQSSILSKLFTLPALIWSLGASASELLFDGGQRSATVAQFRAQYEGDVAAYRQTVLTAFQQVEDGVSTLRITSDQLIQQDSAVAAAQRFVNVATTRYKTGLDPYLNVITAETTLLGDQQTDVTLRVSEMVAAVQLIQALGGGWDVSRLATQ